MSKRSALCCDLLKMCGVLNILELLRQRLPCPSQAVPLSCSLQLAMYLTLLPERRLEGKVLSPSPLNLFQNGRQMNLDNYQKEASHVVALTD